MEERRGRVLTDADIEAIVKAQQAHAEHCRYKVEPEELTEAVRFFRNINNLLEESKRTVRKTILVFVILGFLALVSLGFWTNVRGG